MKTYKELKEEASQGPFEVGKKGNGSPDFIYCDNELGSVIAIINGSSFHLSATSQSERKANAQLIAHTLNHFDALLRALEVVSETCCIDPIANPSEFIQMNKALKAAQTVKED